MLYNIIIKRIGEDDMIKQENKNADYVGADHDENTPHTMTHSNNGTTKGDKTLDDLIAIKQNKDRKG